MHGRMGKVQRKLLAALKEHRVWYAGCGWYWNTWSGTIRLLDSLVKRGYVIRTTRITDQGEVTEYRPKV